MGQLRAGVGRAPITPAIGAWLVGFAGRAGGAQAVRDELYATALVLDDGTTRIAILSCDMIAIHPQLIAQTRDLVHEQTGIPGDNLMICCTHTHSGPPGYASERSRPVDRANAAYLPFRLAGAVRLANDSLAPARVAHDTGQAAIGINRREVIGAGQTILGNNPDGPIDHSAGVLRVDGASGIPLALMVNYACHPVILGPRSLVVSADFVGQARRIVESATGVPMLYVQGACGDINPLEGVREDDANVVRLGTMLASEVVRVWAGTRPNVDGATLAAFRTEVELPIAELPGQARGAGAWNSAERLDTEFPWAADMGDHGARMEIQALAIDDLALVSNASEPFVETGLATKAASPFARTFFAGFTNGCVGYVPAAGAYPHGGYEVLQAYIGYRLPAPIAPEAEQMAVRASVAALEQVKARQ
jgi:hypothetical protein